MRLLLLGAESPTSSAVALEAARRGHEVRILADAPLEHPLPSLVTSLVGEVADAGQLAAALIEVDAVLVPIVDVPFPERLLAALSAVTEAARAEGARVMLLGATGSLRWEEGGAPLIDLGFPEEWKPAARAGVRALELLAESATDDATEERDVLDWVAISPPEIYGEQTPGRRTGAYRIGTDLAVQDSRGRSRIGLEDFAIAALDELERPRHPRQRFTVGY